MKLVKLAVATVLSLAGFQAAAYPTIECLSGAGQQGYTTGYNAQYGVIDHLWTQVNQNECYNLENFIDAVSIPYFTTAPASAYLRCRDQGLIEGLSARVNDAVIGCANEALDNGTEVGNFNGRLYCAVAIQQQYKSVAVGIPLTSLIAEQSCRVALEAYVDNNCYGKKQADLNFYSYVQTACQF